MTESDLERFERLAEEFRRSTGMMAPGKDSPLNDPGEHTWQERSTAWTWWCRGYGCAERNAGEGWVDASERKPDEEVFGWSELVLCFGPGEGMHELFCAAYSHVLNQWQVGDVGFARIVTHWRPLPQPPTTAARREGSNG